MAFFFSWEKNIIVIREGANVTVQQPSQYII